MARIKDKQFTTSNICCGVKMHRSKRVLTDDGMVLYLKCYECGKYSKKKVTMTDLIDYDLTERQKVCFTCQLPECLEGTKQCDYKHYKKRKAAINGLKV